MLTASVPKASTEHWSAAMWAKGAFTLLRSHITIVFDQKVTAFKKFPKVEQNLGKPTYSSLSSYVFEKLAAIRVKMLCVVSWSERRRHRQ